MGTCQTKPIFVSRGGGLSLHGTGDMKGYSFFNQIDFPLKKRFFISPGIQLTNHSQTYWASEFKLNYVTAGADVFTNINYLFTTSLGYNLTPSYSYQFTKRIFLGAKVSYQNDQEGDVITSSSLFAGIKL